MERYRIATGDLPDYDLKPGIQRWRSPSNIALIKYWGKYGDQLPRNPSLSFTLDKASTTTVVKYFPARVTGNPNRIFRFEEQDEPKFGKRVEAYLSRISAYFPFLDLFDLEIDTSNSFPHSAGIASSASAMSALALCICGMESDLAQERLEDHDFLQKASFIARLGSGSACRSVYPSLALWGKDERFDGSSDDYAIPMGSYLHEDMRDMRDSILIVSSREKVISSSQGHALMDQHPFASARYQLARQNLGSIFEALKTGDFEVFGAITEMEALQLHALMMCSSPPFVLLQPNSLKIIESLWEWRKREHLPVYFTLDAGPNIHLLYPENIEHQVIAWIEDLPSDSLVIVIHDRVGNGPVYINGH
jgi:diphosphomevalonate decarboxylase